MSSVATSEEKPSPEAVDGILMDYQNMGVFEKLRGLHDKNIT
jgi:hypothetical protein